MLLIIRTIILIVNSDAFDFFTGAINGFPLSVDLSDFNKSFRLKKITTNKIYTLKDVLFITEVHHVIEKKPSF